MIRSQKQYNVTREQALNLEAALTATHARAADSHQALIAKGIAQQLEQLRAELAEWEALRRCDGGAYTFTVASFGRIADVLVGARIAAGLTQRALAERLGMREQQIQRYEHTGYAHASLETVLDIADELGVNAFEQPATVTVRRGAP